MNNGKMTNKLGGEWRIVMDIFILITETLFLYIFRFYFIRVSLLVFECDENRISKKNTQAWVFQTIDIQLIKTET